MVRKKIHTRSHGSLNDVACIDNRRTTRLDRECLPIVPVCMARFLRFSEFFENLIVPILSKLFERVADVIMSSCNHSAANAK